MKKINCKTYTVHINDWEGLNTFINQGSFSSIFVIVDQNTFQFCLPLFEEKVNVPFEVILTESGEKNKNLESCKVIWDDFIKKGADRHSLCINLGGGVIGDMGGFAASTFMRGMNFIQIPTTLLSQVDASVGGKLGIDYHHLKNLVGIIKNPGAVFVFTPFLKTLPYLQLLSGFAEVIKHGLIRDAKAFEELTQIDALSQLDWEEMIYESVKIKKDITEKDPYERGERKILNFGHTLGHAIESHALSNGIDLLHGEAVAMGMIMETYLSYEKGYLTLAQTEKVKNRVIPLFGHHAEKIPSIEVLMKLMAKDKKNKSGEILFSLLETIGEGNFDQHVSLNAIEKSIEFYKA
ncbi:MAG: 3-dehydroquinate synthase [Saprospiraceae bacterium]|nr:3-dehydroquinate synthase [Saprospiraceae bacterium]